MRAMSCKAPTRLVAQMPLREVGEVGMKRGLACVIQCGIPEGARVTDIEAAEVHAAGRAGGMAPAAGHRRQSAGTLRPDAPVVGGIDAAAGEVGKKRCLAGVVQRGRTEGRSTWGVAEVHAAGHAWDLATRAGHQRQSARTLRPDARVIGGIHAAAGEGGIKRGLASVVQRGNKEVAEVYTAGRAGGLAPAADDQRQAAGTFRPEAVIVGGIHAAPISLA